MRRSLRWRSAVLLGLILCARQLVPSPALAVSANPPVNVTHVVQRGDTLAELAKQYDTSVAIIASTNSIENPDLIRVGERLWVPMASRSLGLPLPPSVTSLIVSTLMPVQGQTWTISIEASAPVTPTAEYDNQILHWVSEGPHSSEIWSYWALVPVPAWTLPGLHPLTVGVLDTSGSYEEIKVDVPVLADRFDTERIVLSSSTSKLLDPQLLQSESNRLSDIWAESVADPLWTEQFTCPVHPIWAVTSPFGQRRAYNEGPVSSYHSGVDYGAKQGALVLAPAAGRVVLADTLNVRGNAIIIDHGAGVHTGYWHLWQVLVEDGDEVAQGDVLGRVGSTGLSTGAHLHWELRVGDVPVAPLQWTTDVQLANDHVSWD